MVATRSKDAFFMEAHISDIPRVEVEDCDNPGKEGFTLLELDRFDVLNISLTT
jgi:nitrate reductase NapAB chaperone NapD